MKSIFFVKYKIEYTNTLHCWKHHHNESERKSISQKNNTRDEVHKPLRNWVRSGRLIVQAAQQKKTS